MTSKWRHELQVSFLAGLAVVGPVAASIWVLLAVFNWITDLILPPALQDRTLTFLYRMLALALVVTLLTVVGWLMRRVLGKQLVAAVEWFIDRVPLLNKVYGFAKEMSRTVLARKKTIFQRVVVVEYPRPGMYTLAFATADTGGEVNTRTDRELVSVFLPTPPNPTTGYLALYPRESVVELEMNVADAMKMSFSGGTVVPPYPPVPAGGGAR